MLFRRDSTLRERATVALANLQRNASAMGMLRSRIESRVNFILMSQGNDKESNSQYQELTRILELVKNGELILNDLSGKMEAARFLEEFVVIINGAAESVDAVRGDMEQLVPIAENALAAMQDAITKISKGLYVPDSQPLQERAGETKAGEEDDDATQNGIIAEATAAVAAMTKTPPEITHTTASTERVAAVTATSALLQQNTDGDRVGGDKEMLAATIRAREVDVEEKGIQKEAELA